MAPCGPLMDVIRGLTGLFRPAGGVPPRLTSVSTADSGPVAGMEVALPSVIGGLVKGSGDRRANEHRLRRERSGNRGAAGSWKLGICRYTDLLGTPRH